MPIDLKLYGPPAFLRPMLALVRHFEETKAKLTCYGWTENEIEAAVADARRISESSGASFQRVMDSILSRASKGERPFRKDVKPK